MGLDQYLYMAKEELDERTYDHLGEKVEDEHGGYYDESSILAEIAYFRKENWLHGYLDRLCEEKTGHGIENCSYFVFTAQELKELVELCQEVIECDSIAFAEDWLPPQSGFFFGSTAIDDYYFEGLADFVFQMEQWTLVDEQFVYYPWW